MKKEPADANRYFDIATSKINVTAKLKNGNVVVENAQDVEMLWYGGFYGSSGLSRKKRDVDSEVGEGHLLPEETVYLMKDLNVLKLLKDGKEDVLNFTEVWKWALSQHSNFSRLYSSYRYYRNLGFVVRNGLKYGCDWLLYKRGPVFDHAVSCVRVFRANDGNWLTLLTNARIASNARKSLRVCFVALNDTEQLDYEACLNYDVISDIELRRWVPEKSRT